MECLGKGIEKRPQEATECGKDSTEPSHHKVLRGNDVVGKTDVVVKDRRRLQRLVDLPPPQHKLGGMGAVRIVPVGGVDGEVARVRAIDHGLGGGGRRRVVVVVVMVVMGGERGGWGGQFVNNKRNRVHGGETRTSSIRQHRSLSHRQGEGCRSERKGAWAESGGAGDGGERGGKGEGGTA